MRIMRTGCCLVFRWCMCKRALYKNAFAVKIADSLPYWQMVKHINIFHIHTNTRTHYHALNRIKMKEQQTGKHFIATKEIKMKIKFSTKRCGVQCSNAYRFTNCEFNINQSLCSDSIGDECRADARIDTGVNEYEANERPNEKKKNTRKIESRLVVMRFFFSLSGGKMPVPSGMAFVVILVFPIILQLMYKMYSQASSTLILLLLCVLC